jgi:ABC-type sugar transport system ATPase subunit
VATIALHGVSRVHLDGTAALDGVDLEVGDGELIGVIGPSGSGKSTLLRVVAGLEPLTSGRVEIAGRDVGTATTRERDLALVTQRRSLYSFLDVAGQLAFPLKVQGMEPGEVGRRVGAERRAFRLGGIWTRHPRQLSAGEVQRTAIARAMVRLPRALLLDEPLQLLDPPTQVRLRTELLAVQRASSLTTIYTTNDHAQVLGIADRVAVLHTGRILQVDTPERLLGRPRSTAVAGFVGEPAMTFVTATVGQQGALGWLDVGRQRLRYPGGLPGPIRRYAGGRLMFAARPNLVRQSRPEDPVDLRLIGIAHGVQRLGHEDRVVVRTPGGTWTARFPSGCGVRPGERVEVTVRVRQLHAFDPADGSGVWHGDDQLE